MKTLIFLLIFSLSIFASMGDCFTCHPKLVPNIENDDKHKPMQTCIKCHTKNDSMATECGDKCFKCHTTQDMDSENIPQHKVFENCRDCHVTQIHKIFDTSTSFDQSHQESLQDFLLK